MEYRKHYAPLESNPDVFTDLTYRLCNAPNLEFQDVLSLDDYALLPRSTLAVVLILPTSREFERRKALEEAEQQEYQVCMRQNDLRWFKQTINNACGFYAILHAVCNSEAAQSIKKHSVLDSVLEDCDGRVPDECARVIEDSAEIEEAYLQASVKSQSATPECAEDEVDFHYICLVHFDGHLFELDGDRTGPLDRGPSDSSMFRRDALKVVNDYVRMEPDDMRFNVLALVRDV